MKYLAFSRLKCPWNSHGHLRGRLRDSLFHGVPWSVDTQQYFSCYDGSELDPRGGERKGRSLCGEEKPLKTRVLRVKVGEGEARECERGVSEK